MAGRRKIEKKYKEFIRKSFRRSETATDIFQNMRTIYGIKSPCFTTIHRYIEKEKHLKTPITSSSLEAAATTTTVATKYRHIEKKYQDFIYKEFTNGATFTEIFNDMRQQFGNHSPNYTTVRRYWHTMASKLENRTRNLMIG